MEFYMGRTLTNTLVNLGLQMAVDESMFQVKKFKFYCFFLLLLVNIAFTCPNFKLKTVHI